LHSGEKKFVCRGSLKDGNNWGCGRRFARADALGRHFRSEAGRICIKPLMDEEAIERGNNQQAEASTDASGMPGMIPGMMPGQPMMQQSQQGFDYPVSHPGGFDPAMQMGQPQMPYRLPQALLQQYPTLGGIWDQLPATGQDDGDISGRSSFDASSAGEFDDDGEYHQGGAFGWASDVGP
jgi:transcription factor CRZ1